MDIPRMYNTQFSLNYSVFLMTTCIKIYRITLVILF